MDQNITLLVILLVIGVSFYHSFYCYTGNNTVSNILCDSKINDLIIFLVIILGLSHFFYEMNNNDMISILLICLLYINLYGLTIKNEDYVIHYIFCIIVFMSLLLFMLRQYYIVEFDYILLSSLVLEIVMGIYLFYMILKFFMKGMKIKINIFFLELFYIFNFVFFIVWLHFIKKYRYISV